MVVTPKPIVVALEEEEEVEEEVLFVSLDVSSFNVFNSVSSASTLSPVRGE